VEWTAFLDYVRGFPDTNGNNISDMPEHHRLPQGRIGRVESWNPVLFYRNATYLTRGATGVIAALFFSLMWLTRLVVTRVAKPAGTKEKKESVL